MGDKNITLFELHLDGETQFGPRTLSEKLPFGEGGLETESESESELESESTTDQDEDGAAADDGGRGSALGVVVALVVLVGIAVAVKKFRGGDEEETVEPEDEPDVIVT
ncbi:hypothetical protein [Natronosalvus rutilus]|uniref:Uncharacterized protein n=1 Tax=Natronosalvus rutilus TaxID=2953753 RepID=A0A9E7N9L9_9EURY|nr:hypothetical protein [Natronosalvus rutilus]UTF53361.1 hypothetical protein NGM29_16565 [Natronosalvus rutilus]